MNVVSFGAATLVLIAPLVAMAQQMEVSTPTPLSQLLAEAQANNSDISAAEIGAKVAKEKIPQATALSDPKFTYQQFSVGSPKPFAGYTNSDFAYIGIGASQELPFPGKLRLRGEVAKREVDVRDSETNLTKAEVVDAVKADYLQLAYFQKTLNILEGNEAVFDQLIQDVTAHYRVGQGAQQDVLNAQVERTKIVRDITMHHQQVAEVEAHLKSLLHRDQTSPDIVAADLSEAPVHITVSELLQMVREHNPQIQVDVNSIQKQNAQLASAKREGKPDFGLSYMYQNTDRRYRDYYMFTFEVSLPRKKRVNAEIAEAAEMLAQSKQTLDAHLQEQLREVQQQYVNVTSNEELAKEYREGLIPQSDAAYRAALNSYASNREQFAQVLSYFVNLLNLKLEYAKALSDREIALAHLETLTGATLR